nr:hypothetical protein BgiMline_003519 [Biomphalaria glabrata]
MWTMHWNGESPFVMLQQRRGNSGGVWRKREATSGELSPTDDSSIRRDEVSEITSRIKVDQVLCFSGYQSNRCLK